MAQLSSEGRLFDMVIIDPPSFAKTQEESDGALHAYSRLVELGLSVLRKGGILVMASCSSRVVADEFFEMILSVGKRVGRPLDELMRTTHAVDHPITYREGAYLKCLFARSRR